MTARIQWDRYEVALLFSTYERVTKGASINIEAAELSETLRTLAIRRGVSIDDTYRNIDGMKMQLANVQYLFTDGEKGLSGASSLIRQMYELYRDIPAEYQKILKEANRMAGITAMSIEDAFFAYAKEKIGLTSTMLTFYLEKAADFCHLKQPLLGMTDVRAIHNVQQKVAGGKLLRFRYGKDAQTIRTVTQLYYTFVKSYRKTKKEPPIQEVPVEGSAIPTEAGPASDTTSVSPASQPHTAAIADTSEEDQPKQPVQETLVISTGDEQISLDAFKEFLIKEKGLAEPTAKNYWTSIRMIEAYIQRNQLGFLLLNADAPGAQRISDLLMARPDFKQINIQRHHQFSAALTQYVLFLQKEQGKKSEQENASSWEEYEAVLKQAFPKGFQKESGLDIKKLRRRWMEVYGKELKDSDEIIRLQLAVHCVDTGKRWYLSELLLSEKDRQTVLHYIDRVLSSGKPILYYSSIYAALENQLESAVLTEDLLASYLQSTCEDRYILRDHYLSNDHDAQVNLYEEIKDVMLARGCPIHTDELKRALHYLPSDQVERELRLHPEFIMDALQVYFHESMADLTDQELDQIAFFIQEELDNQGYMIGDWIQRKLARLYPETAERLSFLTPLGVRGAVAYKLRERFTFSGPVITPNGRAMNMSDIFAMFCQRHAPFTLDDLSDFAKECDSTIYMDTVHENCARVDETTFVAADAVHWDIPHIDAAIALYCPGKYVPLRGIQYFDAFPFVGYPWNSYLLEQYVATVSKDFMLMHSSYAKETTSGAIVRRDAGYERFDDVLADILANAPVPMEQSPCLEYLAGMGYITRRRISNIAEIITKARALRSQRG